MLEPMEGIEPDAWGQDVWNAEKDKERANKVAQKVTRAAALTPELAVQSEKKTAAVCDQPLGLSDELAEHSGAPKMVAGGSHPQATMMQEESAVPAVPSHPFVAPPASSLPATQSLRPAGKGFSSLKGKGRGARSRSGTRVQNATALVGQQGGSMGSLQKTAESKTQDERRVRWCVLAQSDVLAFPRQGKGGTVFAEVDGGAGTWSP